MSETSELERLLIARGDVAIACLQAVLRGIKPALDTNRKTAQQLNSVIARQPSDSPSTLLTVTAQVVTQTSSTLTDLVNLIESTSAELKGFVQGAGIEDTIGDAERNVLSAIRQTSDVYGDKSEEDLRKLVGL